MSLKGFFEVKGKISSKREEHGQKRVTREVKMKKKMKTGDDSDSSDFLSETKATSPESVKESSSKSSLSPPKKTQKPVPISSKSKSPAPNPKKAPKNSPKPSNPEPPSGPLSTKTFVLTGVFKTFSRDTLTDLLKEQGARVTANVSSRTTHLLHGYQLEDGRNYKEGAKYKKATELKKTILDEDSFINLLQSFPKQEQVKKPSPKIQKPASTELLTEKYKPQHLKDLIGNQKTIEKLKTWLKAWDPAQNPTEHPRAVLLSGPPGIGKTTAARLVSQKFGYLLKETNSSDARSKTLIAPLATGTSLSLSISFQGDLQKTLLLMDEVDGMASGDRGGLSALVQMIKSTQVPIICICNERQSPKLKTLLKYCLDLKFAKPNKLQIVKRMQEILQIEGIKIEKNAVEVLVESCGNDIRQIFTFFDLWSRNYSQISYMEAKEVGKQVGKDPSTLLSFFDAGCKLFNSGEMKKLSHKEKIDLAFVDYQMVPMIVHDTYLQAMDDSDLKALSEAADSVALADVLNTEIYKNGKWGLLPSFLQESCIHPSALCKNFVPFTKFPEYFAKSSKARKNLRCVSELKSTQTFSSDSLSIVTELVPLIQIQLSTLLNAKHFSQAAQTLYDLNLTPTHLIEHISSLSHSTFPSAQKKQLLKSYNTQFTSLTHDPPHTSSSENSSSEDSLTLNPL